MNPIKPGWTTTEFFVTVATNVLAVVVLFAPQLSDRIGSQWVQPFAIAAAAVANVVYSHVRGKVKAAAVVAPLPAPAGTDHNPQPVIPAAAKAALVSYPPKKTARRGRNA